MTVCPVVLIFRACWHYRAAVLCAELCDRSVQHVDLVKEVNSWTKLHNPQWIHNRTWIRIILSFLNSSFLLFYISKNINFPIHLEDTPRISLQIHLDSALEKNSVSNAEKITVMVLGTGYCQHSQKWTGCPKKFWFLTNFRILICGRVPFHISFIIYYKITTSLRWV